jgi:uncharacterized membrane protein (UPF0136 family)
MLHFIRHEYLISQNHPTDKMLKLKLGLTLLFVSFVIERLNRSKRLVPVNLN